MALARMDGIVKTWPRILLRIEGAVIVGATTWAYGKSGASWLLFAAGLLLPDLGMVGYLKDSVSGAITYNAVHTEIVPVILLCVGYAQRSTRLVNVALIWLAHINMDRMIAAGLKYGTSFSHTHLSLMDGFTVKE